MSPRSLVPALEALTRRQCDEVVLEREDRRRRGERGFSPLGEDLAVGALAPVLHLTPRTMGTHLDGVRTLVNHLPRTFAPVRAGRLDLRRATAVASEALLLQPEHREAFDQQVTTLGTRCRTPLTDLTPGGVRRRAAAVAVRVDPDSAGARAEVALDERFVRVRPGVDPGVLAQATIHTTIDLVLPLDPRAGSRLSPAAQGATAELDADRVCVEAGAHGERHLSGLRRVPLPGPARPTASPGRRAARAARPHRQTPLGNVTSTSSPPTASRSRWSRRGRRTAGPRTAGRTGAQGRDGVARFSAPWSPRPSCAAATPRGRP